MEICLRLLHLAWRLNGCYRAVLVTRMTVPRLLAEWFVALCQWKEACRAYSVQ